MWLGDRMSSLLDWGSPSGIRRLQPSSDLPLVLALVERLAV